MGEAIMSPARASGISLTSADIPTVLGMVQRNDRSHDIAAWFGVNQGRIKEAKDGKFGLPKAAPQSSLPPKGPPGVKGRALRHEAERALDLLNTGGSSAKAIAILQAAIDSYDGHEV
jgi:hypothetical protein